MDTSDNYLEVNEDNNRVFETLFHQMIGSDKWTNAETQQDIDDSKTPAFCLKTKDLNTKQKIFINFCHSSMMKAPTLDLNEEELRALLASEDSTSFTIPLLIKPFNPTEDKSGSEALVCDVIINTDFYIKKISFSQLYKTFLITVTLETIERDKYSGLLEKNDWILLKNKRYQEVVVKDKTSDKTLVNELSALLNINDINNDNNDGYDYEFVKSKANYNNINGPKTQSMVSHKEYQTIRHEERGVIIADETNGQSRVLTPKYKLKLDVFNNCLEGQVILPHVQDSNQLNLRIGEDRIVLEALNYKLDIFVPVFIQSNQVKAVFNALNNVLKLKMPLN